MEKIVGHIVVEFEEDGGLVCYRFTTLIDEALQKETNKDLHDKVLKNVRDLHNIIYEVLDREE